MSISPNSEVALKGGRTKIEVDKREQSSGNLFANLNISEPSLYLAKTK